MMTAELSFLCECGVGVEMLVLCLWLQPWLLPCAAAPYVHYICSCVTVLAVYGCSTCGWWYVW